MSKHLLCTSTEKIKILTSRYKVLEKYFKYSRYYSANITEMNHGSGTVLGPWNRKFNKMGPLARGTHSSFPGMNNQQIITVIVMCPVIATNWLFPLLLLRASNIRDIRGEKK